MRPLLLQLIFLFFVFTAGFYTFLLAGPGSRVEGGAPFTVIDLQPNRKITETVVHTGEKVSGKAELIDLNPSANVWYVLRITPNQGGSETSYHLENPWPDHQWLYLNPKYPDRIVIGTEKGKRLCHFFSKDSKDGLEAARKSKETYADFCGGKIYLLNSRKARRTSLEAVTDILRDKMPGGEAIIRFVKGTVYRDRYRINSDLVKGDEDSKRKRKVEYPPAAQINSERVKGRRIRPVHLGIALEEAASTGLHPGEWYAVDKISGVYISALQPDMIPGDILKSYPERVRPLDSVESSSLVYLVAFDLNRFDLGFSIGTEHPRVDWSNRVQKRFRTPGMPGPDGIGTIEPLVGTGLVSPVNALRTVATFIGGFKRYHGALLNGKPGKKDYAQHYGFIENGVILSRLQPGLATIFAGSDGRVGMKTWTKADDSRVLSLRHARQNGVPIVSFSYPAGKVEPGPLVSSWSKGNWSGSAGGNLRSLRSAAALLETPRKRFLVYAYFSNATPSAMARVFQAYECQYAMLLDMNALEHTYMALYRGKGDHLTVQHLIRGMQVVDINYRDKYIPRFIGYSDLRDFFYVMRKEH